ncbi:hypothetical protein KSZ_05650 [Dictyobacter formicarum]|uniref:TnsA endonuclease N-terminal domain-containing protein n=1 Tax=Dictyobacter formicarum TaxID=2778368 RepID=A0ABQ3V998_9CHLR|nr:hypothetical protein KSZ_05650 [Dictyobacter formicarum]
MLEMYDQPTRIQLHYQARSGRKTTQWHTPDFFVMRRGGAGFEEWKPANALDKFALTMPYRYLRTATGGRQCPPGEQAASQVGLYYRVRSSAEYHPIYIDNLKFLHDFWTHPLRIEAQQEMLVHDAITAYPGMSVASLMDSYPGLPVDVVWALLAKHRLFTDLSAASLMRWDQVFLYQSEAEMQTAIEKNRAPSQASLLAVRFLWDGRLWEAEVQGTTVVLRPEIGAEFSLRYDHFQRLVDLGQVKPGARFL